MTRTEYLATQKDRGKSLIGVFPAHYPREILWAFNAVPVEIWDPPLEITGANSHLQPYICSVVRLGLELILQGKGDILNGFLFPHTCDSIQNLASIVFDYLGLNKPCYFFYHPKAPYRESSRAYYLEQLKSLVSRLEIDLGPLDRDDLKGRVKQGHDLALLLGEIYRLRRNGGLTASNADFYRTIRQGEYLLPEDFIPVLNDFMERHRSGQAEGPAVIMSGVLPNPPEILELLDGLGVRVADDDLINCGRRLPLKPVLVDDPFETLTEAYLTMPPCTTKASPIEERINQILRKVEESGAKGVIFYLVKFCEPELFDLPEMAGAIKAAGVATLMVDVDLNQGLTGQLTTRVEAFVEMIS
ncbi:MAG: 2-hydroxyacyl-CoA dehydratase [Deltaproteobacteria bacterium]|nr:2-hydroxyacyl-CoA dehydratase [Deltaproteobacteria bacterium]